MLLKGKHSTEELLFALKANIIFNSIRPGRMFISSTNEVFTVEKVEFNEVILTSSERTITMHTTDRFDISLSIFKIESQIVTIADVMLAANNSSSEAVSLSTEGELFSSHPTINYYIDEPVAEIEIDGLFGLWDLRNDSLDKQSPALLEGLNHLF